MRSLLLVAAASALVGGVAGASVTLVATSDSSKKPRNAAAVATDDPAEPPGGASLDERLANLEQSLRALERRRPTLPRALPGVDAGASTGSPDRAPAPESSLVDDPVFEAAVRDVIDRAEADRENEREVRREDRRKQMASRWAEEMVPRLRLNEQQKAKLLEIAEQFMSELGRAWGERDGGAPASRAERRAEMQRLREQSEQRLRSILDPGQMRAYETLDDDDKLGFPRRRGGDR